MQSKGVIVIVRWYISKGMDAAFKRTWVEKMEPPISDGLFREFFSKPTDNPDERFHSLDLESEHYTTYINVGVWHELADFDNSIGKLIPKRKKSEEVGKEDRELIEVFNFEYKLRERIVMNVDEIREGYWNLPESTLKPTKPKSIE